MELFYRNILTNCEYYGKISEQKFQTKEGSRGEKYEKGRLEGKEIFGKSALVWDGNRRKNGGASVMAGGRRVLFRNIGGG